MTEDVKKEKKELREFGLIFGAMVVLIFGLFFPWLLERPWPAWPWIVAAIFAVTGLALPLALKPVYRLWMKIGHVLGWINVRIILGIVFFLLFFPVSLIFRLIGRDPMARRLDEKMASYRVTSHSPPKDQMEKPY